MLKGVATLENPIISFSEHLDIPNSAVIEVSITEVTAAIKLYGFLHFILTFISSLNMKPVPNVF